jgi:hypothetical protein
MSREQREFVEDMEIGSYAFKYNYRGAELRFRHALEYKPGHPDATFKLAESLNKIGKMMRPSKRIKRTWRISRMVLTPTARELLGNANRKFL